MLKKIIIVSTCVLALAFSSCEKESIVPTTVDSNDLFEFIESNELEEFTRFSDGENTYDLTNSLSQENFNYLKEKYDSEEIKYHLSISGILYISPKDLSLDEVIELDESLSSDVNALAKSNNNIGYAIAGFNGKGKKVWSRSGKSNGVPLGNDAPLFTSSTLKRSITTVSCKVKNNTKGNGATTIRDVKLKFKNVIGTFPRSSTNVMARSLAAGKSVTKRYRLGKDIRDSFTFAEISFDR